MAQVDMILVVLILFVALLLFLTLFALVYVSGVFHNVEVGTGKPPIEQVIIAYKFAKGPYRESGQLFTEIAPFLEPEQRTLGIYYDDPKVVSVLNREHNTSIGYCPVFFLLSEGVQHWLTPLGWSKYKPPILVLLKDACRLKIRL